MNKIEGVLNKDVGKMRQIVAEVEDIQHDIQQLAYTSVRSKSWCRMFFQHHLVFIAIISMLVLAYFERYSFSKKEYECYMKSYT